MPSRDLSIPSSLVGIEPFHQFRDGELGALRRRLISRGMTVLPGRCPDCGGLITVETCTITRPGQDPPRITRTVLRCLHHLHQGNPVCPPRITDAPDPPPPPPRPEKLPSVRMAARRTHRATLREIILATPPDQEEP